MDKVITAVVTSLICCMINIEANDSKVLKEDNNNSKQIESVEVKKSSVEKSVVRLESVETGKK